MDLMKNIKNLSIGLLIVAIVLPLLCNFLIGIPRLPNISVVGEATDWLSFYGSYIGSVIATLGSFIILYRTIKNSRHQQKLDLNHKEILALREELADRFGKYCILSELIKLKKFVSPTPEMLVCEATNLQPIRDKYYGLSYSADFLYGKGDRNEERTFYKGYKELMNDTIGLIDELIIFYSKGKWDEDSQSTLQKFSIEINNLVSKNRKVQEDAYKYLEARIKEFRQQQNI